MLNIKPHTFRCNAQELEELKKSFKFRSDGIRKQMWGEKKTATLCYNNEMQTEVVGASWPNLGRFKRSFVFLPTRQEHKSIWPKKKLWRATKVAASIYSHQQRLEGCSFPSDRWRGPTVKREQKSLSQPKPRRVVLIVCFGAVGAAYLIAAITNFPSRRRTTHGNSLGSDFWGGALLLRAKWQRGITERNVL